MQQAKVQEAAEASAQHREDAVWVHQMTSEIQALSSRVSSLLRELLVRACPIVMQACELIVLLASKALVDFSAGHELP